MFEYKITKQTDRWYPVCAEGKIWVAEPRERKKNTSCIPYSFCSLVLPFRHSNFAFARTIPAPSLLRGLRSEQDSLETQKRIRTLHIWFFLTSRVIIFSSLDTVSTLNLQFTFVIYFQCRNRITSSFSVYLCSTRIWSEYNKFPKSYLHLFNFDFSCL